MIHDTCIPEDELAARASGELAEARKAAVDRHIAGCESCRVVLSELARTEGERPGADLLGRYVLQGKVGEGGMGAVFGAWDPKLGRRVAVKILHEAQPDAAHRTQRFLHERQILAGLEHPNIGRLLDAGETGDQRPFFVMEFVDGLPIDQYCDAHKLSTRERLALIAPVCAAVNHAHQNLVVHRDLKPSNILVSSTGVPKLVDFGIAKLLQDSVGLTRTGTGPMTPAYASPEQVRRDPISTASDVYSLGVVLYELLCGVSPYGGASAQIDSLLVAVREAEPVVPSVAAAQVPVSLVKLREVSRERLRKELQGDVDSIVMMALRKEPNDRYASPRALAEDIHAWLDGYPTAARKGTSAYRAAKFVRRHKTSFAALVAAFVALVAGLIGTAWQARAASHGRALAERRFAEVRTLANTVLFDYHDGIAALPGSTPLRERLVKDALKYLDSLAGDARDDPSLQRELAAAYLKVGDVQGDPYASSLGDTQSATASYLRARGIAETILAAAPGDYEARKLVASSHEKVGAIVEVSGDLKGALGEYERARAMDSALALERPADLEQRYAASNDDVAVGQVYIQQGKLEEAVSHLLAALAAREALLATRPDARFKRGLAVAHTSLADVLREQHRTQGALAHYEKAEQLLEELAAADPNAADPRRTVATIWLRHASLLQDEAQYGPSAELTRKALKIDDALLAADPRNAVARRDRMVALYSLGDALVAAKQHAEARPVVGDALEVARGLARDDPSNVQAQRDVSQLELLSAQLELAAGDPAPAERGSRGVIDVAAARLKLDPGNELDQDSVADGQATLASALAKEGKLEEAIAQSHVAVGTLERMVGANPSSARLGAKLAKVELAHGALFAAQASVTKDRSRQAVAWTAARLFHQRAVYRFLALKQKGALLSTGVADDAEATAGLERATRALAALTGKAQGSESISP